MLNLKTKLITVITVSLMFVLTSCDGEEPNAVNYDGCVFLMTNATEMIMNEYRGIPLPKKEIMESLIFLLYPNPTVELVYISSKIDVAESEIVTITITDAKRKIVFDKSFELSYGASFTYQIYISDFPAGDYRVTVTIGKKKSCLILRKVA